MNILTLDIGSSTGWAISTPLFKDQGTLVLATQAELLEQRKIGMERRLDVRFERLFNFVESAITNHQISLVVFEDVEFASTQIQAQLWGRLTGAVWGAVVKVRDDLKGARAVDIQVVNSATLKAYAGEGLSKKDWFKRHPSPDSATTKEWVRYTMLTKHPQLITAESDDNEVDAVWLRLFAEDVERGVKSYGNGQKWERKKLAAKARSEAKRAKLSKLCKKISSYSQ